MTNTLIVLHLCLAALTWKFSEFHPARSVMWWAAMIASAANAAQAGLLYGL